MKRLLTYILLLAPFCGLAQMPANNFCGTYAVHAPINLNGVNGQTITGLRIKGGSVACINLTNCTNITITNCILDSSTVAGVATFNSSNVTVRNCFMYDIARGVNFVQFSGATANLRCDSCWFKNMTGPGTAGHAVQFNNITGAGCSMSYNIVENLPGASTPSDCFSFYQSNGTSASPMVCNHNWMRCTGTNGYLTSAAGVVLGDGGGSWQTCTNNVAVNTCHGLFTLAGGSNMVIANNTGYLDDPVSPNPVGIQVAIVPAGSTTCSNISVTGNAITCIITATGAQNPYWIPTSGANACSAVTSTPNNWNAGLTPAILPAVLIPTCTVSPPAISYSPNAYTYYISAPITPVTPTNTGGASSSWSISPALPSGLLFSTTTGVISGTPTALSPTTAYTVTATNAGGRSSTTVSFTVINNPPVIHYSPNTQVCTINVPITTMTPLNGGGTATSYTISPALPAGLSFNTSTGVISGTPTVLLATTSFTVTAFNSGGNSPTTVTLTVNNPAPAVPAISYSPNTEVLPIGVPITPLVPANSGGAATSWGISPALPAGLSFNTSTGVISGTPTVVSPVTPYTVSATNVSGTGTTTVTLSVVNVLPQPPSITYNPSSVALQINQVAGSLYPINTGGTATGWSVLPALPAGLTINSSTGIISGTPTVLAVATGYVVTATNTGGSGQFTITISVVPATPGPILRANGRFVILVVP